MLRQTVPAVVFAALLVASPIVAATPVAAADGHSPTLSQHSPTDAETPFNQTAFVTLADAGDGAVVAGGARGIERPNATLARIEDGDPVWTAAVGGDGLGRVVDVAVTDAGEVYFLSAERPNASTYETDLVLGHTTEDGDLVWREALDETSSIASTARIVASDDGVTVAHGVEGGVRLAEYASGDPVWEQTYGVEARPQSLERTDDGYLIVGDRGFGEPWVLRASESGNARLNETLTGLEIGSVRGGTVTDDGDILLAGQHRAGFGSDRTMGWTASVDDGVVQWTRVHDLSAESRITDVLARDDGLVFVAQSGQPTENTTMQLLGVGANGAVSVDERVDSPQYVTATALVDGDVTVAGVSGLETFMDTTFEGTIQTVSLPDSIDEGDATLAADVGLTSNATVYRGQNVRVGADGPSDTYELVRVHEDGDEVVRRITASGSGPAVFESATLPAGEYVLRTADGQPVAVTNGTIQGAADRETAAFTVETQRFFGIDTNRTFVDVADGERAVSLAFDSGRDSYDVYVTVSNRYGADPSADAVRAAFASNPGFAGVETVDGQPTARITVDDDERVNATAAALSPGLYDVTVRGVDTGEGGAVASARVVVGTEQNRPIGLDPGTDSLTVTAGGETNTSLALTNVTDGISAMSLSANLSGEPLPQVRLRGDINASWVTASGYASPDSTGTETTHFDGQTPNGTVTVGELRVEARAFGDEAIATGTNNVSLRVDWVVDENGVPYSVPDGQTLTVTVVPAENATTGEQTGEQSGEQTGEQSSAPA
jgi:hypothetical protein